MARERIIDAASAGEPEDNYNLSLRPESMAQCIGQKELMDRLAIAICAALQRKEPLDHVLLHGPPGLGKTTLAHVIAHEMKARIRITAGPALAKPSDLVGMLTNLQRGDVVFIDEVHRTPAIVEEFIYPAMEDFRVDFTVDSGMHARTINLPLKPFTLIGATTRAGLLTAPLRARFGIVHHLDYWSGEDLLERARRTADMLGIKYEEKALAMLASRSRGTPRITNRLLRRVRDFAQIKAEGKLTEQAVADGLELEGIDNAGLDRLDHAFLQSLIGTHKGGPAGIEALAATLGEERDTLEDVVEPFLLQRGFVARTKRGRVATAAAYKHLGLEEPDQATAEESTLF